MDVFHRALEKKRYHYNDTGLVSCCSMILKVYNAHTIEVIDSENKKINSSKKNQCSRVSITPNISIDAYHCDFNFAFGRSIFLDKFNFLFPESMRPIPCELYTFNIIL